MIRRGKSEGWLQLPSEALLPWASLNDASFDRTIVGHVEGKGGALLAKEDLDADNNQSRVLLTVPRDLVLSLDRVHEHAKVDRDFREVLESVGNFGRTPRGAILSLLLFQASISCPDLPESVGVHNPFVEYVKSLPLESLPTFWSPSELQLLLGTTLAPAISAKLRSLRREYDSFCTSLERTRWYLAVQDHLEFDDWLQVDAMYRSRALEYPDIGHCMVPLVDIANHAAGDATVAIYEKDGEGNAVLLLRDGKKVKNEEEVTITYGDEKGACEMLFSYGFLEEDKESAETLFLSLNIPDSDKFQSGKNKIADSAPGFKVIDTGDGEFDWTGDFIWLLCVNEDDGLKFELARTVDGQEEMQALFLDREIQGGATELKSLLAASELWDVYRLRAIAILQQRVYEQLELLHTIMQTTEDAPVINGIEIRQQPYDLTMKLRELEFDLLERAYEWFENEKCELAESPVVGRYLAQNSDQPQDDAGREPEDFS